MRGAVRWVITMSLVAAAVGVVTGCGTDTSAGVSVPAAPGAPLVERVLTTDELGIPGYQASREPVVPVGAKDFLAGDCPEVRDASLKVLDAAGLEAAVRRGFTADGGGGLSAVWQFATPAGATAWTKEVLDQTKTDPGSACIPKGVVQTGWDTRPVAGLPGGILEHATQTTPDGRSEAWNLLFTDGRFAYVVGTAGAPGRVEPAQVEAAARRQWARGSG